MRKLLFAALTLVPVVGLAQSGPHPPDSFATKRSIPSRPGKAATQNKTVFIGGVYGFANLLNPAIANPLIANGRIGLYEHAVAMEKLTAAQRLSLLTLWAPTGTNPNGGGQGIGEVVVGGDFGTGTSGGQQNNNQSQLWTNWGIDSQWPVEINASISTNISTAAPTGTYTAGSGDASPGRAYGGYVSSTDLRNSEATVNLFLTAGPKNVTFFVTPNGGVEDLIDPFATGGFWANTRALWSYAGGGGIDSPPYFLLDTAHRLAGYQPMIVQQIRWLNAQGLRSSYVVSPGPNTAGLSYDNSFFADTAVLYKYLLANNALPTQWVVENYTNPL